jgi:hypothetical protein
MKLFKLLVLAFGLTLSAGAIAQDVPVEDLPVATIDENYYVTLPEMPVQEYYFVDISHLDFADEQEAVYLLTSYVTANLISNEIFYAEGYMVIRIHLEYIPEEEVDLEQLQDYLNHLTKPE